MQLGSYALFILVPFVIGLAVQGWLRNMVKQNSQLAVSSGLSGAEVARWILDRNGLTNVSIQMSRSGAFSDHYDPRTRGVSLSPDVFSGRSVAAAAIAAHEAGHALQHAYSYAPMVARTGVQPLAAFGSHAWYIMLLLGLLLRQFDLVGLALLVFALVVLFQIVTLPVEFNASRRALGQLRELEIVGAGQIGAARSTLVAAALTYVAAALASISQLLYFLFQFGGGD